MGDKEIRKGLIRKTERPNIKYTHAEEESGVKKHLKSIVSRGGQKTER